MHHKLDINPIPKEVLYINEPWLVDQSLLNYPIDRKQPDSDEDNIRVYVPLDINHNAILRRIHTIIAKYKYASESNEADFSEEIGQIIHQIEIYDQIWYVREMPENGNHSLKGIHLVKDVIECLENIPDHCTETFPFDVINELKDEYLK